MTEYACRVPYISGPWCLERNGNWICTRRYGHTGRHHEAGLIIPGTRLCPVKAIWGIKS